ncbi:hypothetical protein EJ076_16705 [Mesorhizobium sp. M7D.F.Ca.US.005.01.1.1]|uniref:hypothetical protein n=1 Tax=Mesorhizobium sp. M7D.F.Ca.US.005.01.1.1 TaxID=2493678 RepID=UPI000F7561BC|nr:hypothetical protein [Mesorhizobium sp. M7D.F.Ca.US.005.01.1.1]AZO42612.1 hypothetical protein EJ076_16705 [Mesorhizobium sp. M7D.F.Ca.US.005.01.1.1]
MRGRGWIKALRQDEARQVRARIAELERDLMATSPQGRHRRHEAGHELRNAKFRLERLEECIAEIPERAEF